MDDQFRLSDRVIQAIEAQIALLVHDGGFGEVTLIVERHRVSRITTTTSAKIEDRRQKR